MPNNDQTDTDSDDLVDVCDQTPLPEHTQIAMLAAGAMALTQLHRRRQEKLGRMGVHF